MCVYLLLAFIKHKHRLSSSLQEALRLLQLNLFERRDLMALLKLEPPPIPELDERQLVIVGS